MRIVSGIFRGKKIIAPKGDRTRPTTDRMRETLFNLLCHGIDGFALENTHVIDMFAGSGALGLEALSRGAGSCVFMETDPDARKAIKQNIHSLGICDWAQLYPRSALNTGRPNESLFRAVGLVFADPPYGRGMVEKALQGLQENDWLTPNAVCAVETGMDESVTLADWGLIKHKIIGRSAIHILRRHM